MDMTQCTNNMTQFRERLYQNFGNRADTLMELVDGISSVGNARSVVEYSLAASFRRSYSTIFKALNELAIDEQWLVRQVREYLPRPQKRPFWLLMVDVTSAPRPYAPTLADRGMVYQPEVVKGKKPLTIGHQYSTVALGLEEEAGVTSSWVLPLLTKRVASAEDKEMVGAVQVDGLLTDPQLPFARELTVAVGDSSYSKAAYLHAHRQHPNLVSIGRVRSNRTFYHSHVAADEGVTGAGHPTWYGARFALSDAQSWTEADETLTLQESSRRGALYRTEVQAWHNLLMPGSYQPQRLAMHEHPFTLLRIVRYNAEGHSIHQHPLWLLVMGQRRHALTLHQIFQAYACRFNLEHFFRFGKQKLLLAGFQTPEVEREEKWWQLVPIAYVQLWMARHIAHALPPPWQRNLPLMQQRLLSPTLVQRDFARIIRHLGTPAKPPKHRGISPGRPLGTRLPKRPRHKVVLRSQITAHAR